MTRRPFDPNELDQPSADADRTIADLGSYLVDTATGAPRGLEQRVMTALEREPTPRPGVLAWLLTPSTPGSGMRGLARAGLLAATLVIAVAGALFAGQLADLLRDVGNGSPTPTESVSPPPPSESVAPSATTAEPSSSPEASEDGHQTPGASGSPQASEDDTVETSPDESGEALGPSASESP